MFFIASKIFSFLITPIVWVTFFLFLSLFSKSHTRKKRFLLIGVVLFYFFSNSFLLEEVMRAWEIPAIPYQDLKTYDAGIVLGGILQFDARLDRIQFQRGADRLFQAIDLYKKGFIKHILFSGGSGSIEFSGIKEGTYVKKYLHTLGIPDEDVWIENESNNTRENAEFTKHLLDNKSIANEKFLLITSAFHMRRSVACFKKVGIFAEPYSVDRLAGKSRRFTLDHLCIPNSSTFFFWDVLIHEWVGLLMYKINGYT